MDRKDVDSDTLPRVDWEAQPLGKETDKAIGKRLSVTESGVRSARVKRKIPAIGGIVNILDLDIFGGETKRAPLRAFLKKSIFEVMAIGDSTGWTELLDSLRWPDGRPNGGKFTDGTFMEGLRATPQEWVWAIYVMHMARNGQIESHLTNLVGMNKATARTVAQRIIEMENEPSRR